MIPKAVITILIALFMSSCKDSQNIKSDTFEVKRGTNIAHWLSQSDKRGQERVDFFRESDVKKIASLGFDHIRLPIDEEQMWDENGNRHKEAFKLLQNAIDWCELHDLRVIVDLHILRSHYFNAEVKPLWTDPEEQEKFFDLWRDLSKALNQYPNNLLAYELMNEAVADDHELWNSLVKRAHTAIRKLEPKRTIVIGSNRWQSTDTFDALKVPENDPNILLSFHFYEPFLLTHYNAEWTFLDEYNGPVQYPGVIVEEEAFQSLSDEAKEKAEEWVGTEFNKEELLKLWKKPIQKAKETGLSLYCGEFGIISHAPDEDALDWYRDMIQLFDETGIGFANWNYKSDNFGLYGIDNSENEELVAIVTKQND
ncbi:MAG: glycoside hydrolase family 5 protein [Bacteroidota bacterium]